MRTSVSAIVLTVLVACSSGTRPPTGPASGSASGSATSSGDDHAPAPGPGIGETCAAQDTCAEGLACVSYYGIAGASGPLFKSCEKKCGTDDDCPAPRRCATIADGPGRVCR